MNARPFQGGDTFSLFSHMQNQAMNEIGALENEYVLQASPTELEDYFLDKFVIVPLSIDTAGYYMEEKKSVQIDAGSSFPTGYFPGASSTAPGTALHIAVPYTGDKALWNYQPSTFTLSAYPEIDVRDDVFVFVCTFRDDSADAVRLKNQIEENIRALVGATGYLRNDVQAFNSRISSAIQTALAQKLAKARTTAGALAALSIPMKLRDQPSTFVAPTTRRRPPVARPAVAKESFTPEPVLDQGEYEHILSVVKSMSLVMERSPETFASLDEEAIRTHFLLQLNGHYDGTATGETFNAAGKTDILIRVENRNIFIAECKFWRGEKSFDEAIDQLLGYLSWRDSKSALLVFNRNKSSTAVRQKMHEVMLARPEHRKTSAHNDHGDSRYIFVKPGDPGREIQVSTMLFDIPSGEKGAG
jgi:hypothetical protein